MNADKPVHADNVPTTEPRQPVSDQQIAARVSQLRRERKGAAGNDDALTLEAKSQLEAEAEARPVAGTPSRPYTDEPGQQLRSRTKVQDPAEAAVQPRSATEAKSRETGGELRDQ